MQLSEKIETRRLVIRMAEKRDLRNYKSQLKLYSCTDKLNIIESPDTNYLAIDNEDGKMIGIIQIDDIDEKTAYLKISIPNKSWKIRYGKEAIHQFVKCCQERHLCDRLYLKQNNSIVREYMNERPELFKKGLFIEFEVA